MMDNQTEGEHQVAKAKQALSILRVHAAQLKELESARADLAQRVRKHVEKLGGPETDDAEWPALASATRLLIELDPTLQDKALRSLPEDIRQHAVARLYSFEAIPMHTGTSIQKLLRTVGKRDLATALLGADEEILAAVVSNMSKNAAQMLHEDMESVERREDLTSRDVRDARATVDDEFHRLYEAGELGDLPDE